MSFCNGLVIMINIDEDRDETVIPTGDGLVCGRLVADPGNTLELVFAQLVTGDSGVDSWDNT